MGCSSLHFLPSLPTAIIGRQISNFSTWILGVCDDSSMSDSLLITNLQEAFLPFPLKRSNHYTVQQYSTLKSLCAKSAGWVFLDHHNGSMCFNNADKAFLIKSFLCLVGIFITSWRLFFAFVPHEMSGFMRIYWWAHRMEEGTVLRPCYVRLQDCLQAPWNWRKYNFYGYQVT